MEPVEYQIPVPVWLAEHMALTNEIIDAMMTDRGMPSRTLNVYSRVLSIAELRSGLENRSL